MAKGEVPAWSTLPTRARKFTIKWTLGSAVINLKRLAAALLGPFLPWIAPYSAFAASYRAEGADSLPNIL